MKKLILCYLVLAVFTLCEGADVSCEISASKDKIEVLEPLIIRAHLKTISNMKEYSKIIATLMVKHENEISEHTLVGSPIRVKWNPDGENIQEICLMYDLTRKEFLFDAPGKYSISLLLGEGKVKSNVISVSVENSVVISDESFLETLSSENILLLIYSQKTVDPNTVNVVKHFMEAYPEAGISKYLHLCLKIIEFNYLENNRKKSTNADRLRIANNLEVAIEMIGVKPEYFGAAKFKVARAYAFANDFDTAKLRLETLIGYKNEVSQEANRALSEIRVHGK